MEKANLDINNPNENIILSDSKLRSAASSSFILVLWTIAYGLIAISGQMEKFTTSKEIIYNIIYLVSLVTVLVTLKKYLNQLDNYFKLNATIYAIISLEIVSSIIDVILQTKYKMTDNIFLESTGYIVMGILGILYLVFSIRLLYIKNDYSGLLNIVAFFMLFSVIIGLACILIFIENDSDYILMIAVVFEALPYLILAQLFRVTRRRLKQENII